MKFEILIQDLQDEYLDFMFPDKQPVKNSYSEDITEISRYNSGKNELWTWKPILVIDENNQPKAEMQKIVEPKPPDEYWFKFGKNHQQIDDKNWQKEITTTHWYIDIDTLENLIEFLKQNNGQLDCDTVIPTIRLY